MNTQDTQKAIDIVKKMNAHNDALVQKLEQTNARIRELEKENQENLSIIESIAKGLSENPISLCKGVMQCRNNFLKKFAIDKEIEALENAMNTLSLHGLGDTGAASDLMDDIEQLRKERGEC